MEKFYRNNSCILPEGNINNDIYMKIIEWYNCDQLRESEDSESDSGMDIYTYTEANKSAQDYVMRVFGVTRDSKSITVELTGFRPFYYIKVKDSFSNVSLQKFIEFVNSNYLLKNFKDCVMKKECRVIKSKDIYGFNNDKLFTFVKIVFSSYSSLMRSRYIFKNPVHVFGVTQKETKFELYESNFEPFMRYSHIQKIHMAGWIKLPFKKFKQTINKANTQLEVTIDHKDIIPMTEDLSSANFLQASWDIEVFSVDNSFPKPFIKENVVFQIAITYKYNLDKSGRLLKHLLTLKKCSKINDPDVIVEECTLEIDLIKRFVKSIKGMDPDIMYTYNGDSFDCMYMYERAKLHGLELYFLSGLSRLKNINTVMKKEMFSSSAYGDSEMYRLYIPGRLNYDLLIHFKRGMKKYASYKLDNIAEAILGEKKNPVSVKQIFSFYKEGNPDRIREVGEYCIQDTALLQKLVDNQLILSSITQLANVTYVPISFLLTRGQTVKVLSQIYRKARQMGYLVPHTNFNADSFSSAITIAGNGSNRFKEGDFIKINCGVKKSSGIIDKVLSNTCLEVSTNSEIDLLDSRNTCNLVHSNDTHKIVNVDDITSEESFSGATVLTAIPGIFRDNIAILDFASLYPTIMISRNLCYSTFVMDPKYLNIPGVNYEVIEWNDEISVKVHQTCDAVMATGIKKGEVCGKQAFFNVAFKHYCRVHDPLKKTRGEEEKCQKKKVHYKYTIVQPGPNGENKGVVPALLEELYNTRKLVKKQMAIAYKNGDRDLVNILNSNQMAIKVSLNSTYGFLGRSKGNLILKELGSIVTSVGRMLIEQSKEYAEGAFLEYIKNNGILVHQIKTLDSIDKMSETAKDNLLLMSASSV